MIECELVPFVGQHQMCGRCNAEGFENKHKMMNHIRRLFATIKDNETRVHQMNVRNQACLSEELQKAMIAIAPDQGKKRGPYKTKATKRASAGDLDAAQDESEAPEGYFATASGKILPSYFLQAYRYCERKEVPEEWKAAFYTKNDLGSIAKAKAEFL